MFGVIPAGQPPNTNPQAVSQTQFAFNLAPPFNHIVVFLLPGSPLPDGTAAGVYCQLPGATEFRFLGALGNQKQSAIFKIKAGPTGADQQAATGGDDVMLDDATLQPATEPAAAAASGNVVLGVSVEPVANIENQLESLRANQPAQASGNNGTQMVRRNAMTASQDGSVVPTKVLAQRIIQNAFNFLSSFGDTVPLKSFQDWWTKFEKRIELDPGFLERDTS